MRFPEIDPEMRNNCVSDYFKKKKRRKRNWLKTKCLAKVP